MEFRSVLRKFVESNEYKIWFNLKTKEGDL